MSINLEDHESVASELVRLRDDLARYKAAYEKMRECVEENLNELMAYAGEEENEDTPTGGMIRSMREALARGDEADRPGVGLDSRVVHGMECGANCPCRVGADGAPKEPT